MLYSRRLLMSFGLMTQHHTEVSLVKEEDHVARLIMNRPMSKNAIGEHFLNEMRECLRVCCEDKYIRCLVVESQVKGVFCAGADLKERKSMSVESARAFVSRLRDTFNELEDLECPTISAIDGVALGGGCELALSTDIRIAAESARMGLPEAGWGIIPGAGGTYRAPKVLGLSRALQLVLTAEPVGASKAQQLGLVNEVVPAGEAVAEAMKMARRIAQNGPLAIRAAKQVIRNGYGCSRSEALKYERSEAEKLMQTKDRDEGLRAFAEKRKPCYKGE